MNQRDYLLTGASGFLGKIIATSLPGSVSTLGRSSVNDYKTDLSREVPAFDSAFETIIHASGKAHIVPSTKEEADDFHAVNVSGTINLTKGLEALSTLPRYFIFISTVAVYGKDSGEKISEEEPLKGATPYAVSKIKAEQFLQDWCAKHNVILTVLRLPLLVAADPPGNLGSMVRMMKKGLYVGIGSGQARKSMVLAEDVARFIPVVKKTGGIFNLTDGDHPAMVDLEEALAKKLGKRTPVRLPNALLKTAAQAGDLLGNKAPLNSLKYDKLISSLTFSDSKARSIGWNPRKVIANLPF
jgi:nucleoside-diphosphate-sugar epimerase